MIVLTCTCVPHPGRFEEARDAALDVTAASRAHAGLIGYFWNLDDAARELRLVEVHEDEASVQNHIALTDLSRLAAAGSFRDIQVFGDPPSAELRATLEGFGDVRIYPAVGS
ncbi:antibiotic biosynthesis monooxygenase [Microbacterium sp. X-17]|uniref:putative quinol monooxygenase n=1 Tax=Microbacterium sp. X-17 TaxID=3144404 RepID=UPI0031F4B51A